MSLTIARKKIIMPADVAAREPYSYVRVSTYLQKQRGFSLPHQFELCDQAALAAGRAIPAANRLHDADSGRSVQRKDLQALLEHVKAGRVSVVYCPKVDRLCRSARDGLEILDVLHAHGTELVLVENNIDTRTPLGKLFFTLLAAFAEWEAEMIRERTWSGKYEQLSQFADQGRSPAAGGRDTPYGYLYVPGAKGQDGRWERHPDQWRTVLFIFEQVSLGKGGDAVARLLNERGVPAPRGATWNAVAIRRMVRNTAYIGRLVRKMNDQEFVFSVPRIVPDDLLALAGEAIDGNRRMARRNAKHDYLLSSSKEEPLLRCLACHRQGKEYMMGGRSRQYRPTGSPRIFYRCNGPRSAYHETNATRLDRAIWEALVEMLSEPGRVLENISKLADAASKQYQDLQAELAALTERAGEIRAAQVRLAEAAAWGKLPADILHAQADALEEEAQEIAGQISLAHVQIEQAKAETVPIRDVEEACALLRTGAEGATFEERQWIVRTLVERVYADKDEWVLEGRLPTLRASGSLGPRAIAEQPS